MLGGRPFTPGPGPGSGNRRSNPGGVRSDPVQHSLQPVEGQGDAVVGDPTLGEIVGADALTPVPVPTWLLRSWAICCCCS